MRPTTPLNEAQKNAISDALPAYRLVLKRAYSGASKTLAIKAFCLQCTGYLRAEVRACSAHACPLWPYRPYQTDKDKNE